MNEHIPAQRAAEKIQARGYCYKEDCASCTEINAAIIEAEYSGQQRIVEAAKAYVEADSAYWEAIVFPENRHLASEAEVERAKALDALVNVVRRGNQNE